MRGSDLAALVMMCLDHGGVVSRHCRKQFEGKAPEELFDFLEQAAARVLGHGSAGEPDEDAH